MKMMQSKGHRIILITNEYPNVEKHLVAKYYDGIEIVFTDASLENFQTHQNLNNSFLMWKALDDLIEANEIKLDFVVIPDCGSEGFFMILNQTLYGKYPDIKFVVEVEGPMNMVAVKNRDSVDEHFTITGLMEEFTFRNSKYFTFPTEIMMKELKDQIKIEEINYKLVPNLVNNDFVPGAAKHNPVTKNIFFVGRLEYRKGADLLIQAFIQIIEEEKYNDAQLYFVGKDQYWNDYGKTFQEYWCEKLTSQQLSKIHFLQFLPHDELIERLAESRVCVFPSRWEPFGNVALEAILAGVPVIVPKGTGLAEIVDRDYDWLFEAENIGELKNVLKKALDETEDNLILRSENLVKRAKEVLAISEESFCSFLEETKEGKGIALNEKRHDAKLIFEIFSVYIQLTGNPGKKFKEMQKDYFKVNQLYQDISKFYAELQTQFDQVNKENLILKKYLNVLQNGKVSQ
ncbi:MAG: glycosyltransferase [Ignavibacteriales bacterium]|nr:MAG: glycosyltransferase [Ignavibacteriales bacterium]